MSHFSGERPPVFLERRKNMLKRSTSLILVVLVFNLATFARSADDNVRTKVAKIGTGSEARVTVKLKDGRKIKGYIKEFNDDQFVVVDTKGNLNSVVYADAVKVDKRRKHKPWIFVATAAAIIFVPIILLAAAGDDF
jgi:sRNA-binding regulator protein Hfq